jgi:hypothetical protein
VWQLALVWLLGTELFPEAAAMSLLPPKIIEKIDCISALHHSQLPEHASTI